MADPAVSVHINRQALTRALALAPKFLESEIADAFQHYKSKFFKTLPGVSQLKPRSRGFWRIIQGYVNRKPGNLERINLRLVSYWKGARIQEEGGPKAAQSGKYMTIPIGAALTSTGRVKKRYRDPKKVRNLFSLRKGSELFLYQRGGTRGKRAQTAKPVYLLKRTVPITARLGFERTFDSMETFRQSRINTAVDRALRRLERTRSR